jgi:hypothetical protein
MAGQATNQTAALQAAPEAADRTAVPAVATALAWLDGLEPTYLRRRTLRDGPKANYLAFVRDTVATLDTMLSSAELADVPARAMAARADLSRIALNTAAFLALRAGAWDTARDLAREVVARDHHDLMAQRLIDAAQERSPDLETETDRWLRGRTCNAPFRQIETRADMAVHICCSAWQPVPIGRIGAQTETPFWNSDAAREIRRSVTEGDFTHCSRWHCPSIAARRLP